MLRRHARKTLSGSRWSGGVLDGLGGNGPVTHTVSDDGSFGTIKDADKIVESIVAGMAKKNPALTKANTTALKTNLGKMLPSALANNWHEAVAMWTDTSLEVGRHYHSDEEISAPGASAPIRLLTRFSLSRRCACNTADTQNRCVELKYFAEPDSAKAPAVIETVNRQLAGAFIQIADGSPPKLSRATMETELTVIAEADTLLPHEVRRLEKMSLSFDTAKHGDQTVSLSNESTLKYTYLQRE